MPHSEALRWNKKYSKHPYQWLSRPSNSLLQTFVKRIPKQGKALVAACGVGTNALFLAEHGLGVIGLDISEVALRISTSRAKSKSLPLRVAVVDLANLWLPPNYFDVITNFRFLERSTLPVYKRALKTGGIIFFDQLLEEDPNKTYPLYYLKPGELIQNFANYKILYHEIAPAQYNEKRIEKLVAQKC